MSGLHRQAQVDYTKPERNKVSYHIRNIATHSLSHHAHFHASPEGGRRLVVPRIDDTTPDMFPW